MRLFVRKEATGKSQHFEKKEKTRLKCYAALENMNGNSAVCCLKIDEEIARMKISMGCEDKATSKREWT